MKNVWSKLAIALGATIGASTAFAQLPSGWSEQSTSTKLASSSSSLRVIRLQNTSGAAQYYNLFLGPTADIAVGTTRKITIRAAKVSGAFSNFGVGFHIYDSSGKYVTEAGQEFASSLQPSLTSMSYTYSAAAARKIQPRISIPSIPNGATLEFSISDSVVLTNGGIAATPTPRPTATPTPTPPPQATPTPAPTATPNPQACGLTTSGPITVTRNGQVIENMRITSTNGEAITVDGFSDVVIRNVEIKHKGGAGIAFNNAPRIRIENVSILYTGAPAAGANPSFDHYNIGGTNSPNAVITRARVEKGSSGIWLGNCQAPRISFLEGHDFRGPFPRGQLAQFDHSNDAILEDFSAENGATSWTEDNVNVWRSSRATIRRGLVDGNNSPSGVGVIFEHDDGIAKDGLVEDVDAVRQGNGCFSGYPGVNVTFNRTRCSDNICSSQQGRGKPLSNALAWGGEPEKSRNLKLIDSKYQRLCNPDNVVWDDINFTTLQVSEASFVPRAPQRLKFCWQ